uniref:NADH-ubiquinone oxidoreductase chain 2 n=1 Tax=Elateroidea sp. 4 KM-2017 TaxID=2219427 RepID=A0A346RGF5_9COLE|nr:NADH dehydrogenase subunit 2 [Elateroidea sp. 4 KM-2017]
MFLSSLVMGTLISISSYSWLAMWLGLEINLLSIIPLMQSSKNILSNESSIKYFITQAVASTIILVSIIILSYKSTMISNSLIKSSTYIMMNSSFLTKMGMAPFHFWFPEVMEGLSWLNCLLILTWQKIAPMILLMYSNKLTTFIMLTIIIAMIISGVMGVNQISLRKILAYSSINHMGWMMSTLMINETIWMYYFIIYSIISINIVAILNKFKIFFLNQLFQTMNSNTLIKFFFIFNFLSLGGIPPFLGFFPKWLTVQILIQQNMYVLPLTMIIFTLISIYMYTRITMSSLILNINEQTWEKHFNMKSISKFLISTLNFLIITGLILVTVMFNIL